MRIYLIRHPRPAIASGVCYGASDLDLAGDALACAPRLRAQLPADIALYSSPLRRCRRLAEALHPAPQYDARLRELHFGAWELQPWDEIPRAELDAWAAAPLDYAPPGGESVGALRTRVGAFLREHGNPGGADLAIVTHAGVMKCISAQLQGLADPDWLALRFDYGEMRLIERRPHD